MSYCCGRVDVTARGRARIMPALRDGVGLPTWLSCMGRRFAMARYQVTLLVETGEDDDDAQDVEQTICDAVGADGWTVTDVTALAV